MAESQSVLVTGATGAVGPAVVGRLREAGCRVRALSRGARAVPWPIGDVPLHPGDVGDRAAVARAVAGVDWVFHLAGLLHVTNPPPELAAEYERVNVDGARVVAEESARAGVKRLVLFSTIAVYGRTDHSDADEDTPPAPDTPYGRSKVHSEAAVLEVARESGLPTSILRLAAVYGPRVKGNYARLAEAIAARRFVPVGPGRNRRTLVHEADVAEAALLVASDPRAAGRLYNVSDGHVHRLHEIIDAICAALDRPSPRVRVPLALARAGARSADRVLSLAGRRPSAGPMLDKYCEDAAVRAERIRRELGFEARFDLLSGWRDALAASGGRC